MFKKILITVIFTLSLSNALAQDKNTIYMETAGAAILYSFNYERNITDKITARVGYSTVPFSSEDTGETLNFTIMPIMGNYLLGSGNHKIALSAGVINVSADGEGEEGEYSLDLGMLTAAGVGYRYHRSSGGFFFNLNVGLAPIPGWPGVAFGWTF